MFKLKNSFLDIFSLINFIKNGAKIALEEKHSAALASFIVFYFAELASYMTFLLFIPDSKTTLIPCNIALFSGTLIGGIVASFLLAKGKKIKNILIHSIRIYLTGTVIFFLLSLGKNLNVISDKSQLFSILAPFCYFIFGVGFSGTIGLVVTQITESFPRYNRSFAVGAVHFDGFISPVVIAGLVWYLKGNPLQESIVLGICVLLGLFSLFYSDNFSEDIIRNEKPRTNQATWKEWLSWFGFDNFTKENSTSNARAFWNSAFSGLSLTFFFFLFTNIKFLSIFSGVENYHIILFGYIGLATGSLFWTWRSKILASRKRVIFHSNVMQLCIIIYMMYLYANKISLGLWDFVPVGIALGFSCSWTIVLLQASENFLHKQRGSLMVLIPNFYRFFSVILTLTLFREEKNEVQLSFHYRDEWFLLVIALVLILISMVSAFALKDRFGVDAIALDVENDKSLVSTELRKNLNEIKVEDNDKVHYLEAANKTISNHFKREDSLGRLFYMCTIYHRNKNQNKITSPNLMEHLELFNEQTYIERAIEKDLEKVAFTHVIGDKLIENAFLQSTSWWIANDDNVNGMLIWNSGTTQVKTHKHSLSQQNGNDKKVIVIDLQDIILPKKLSIFPNDFMQHDWKKRMETDKLLSSKEEESMDSCGLKIWSNHLNELKSKAEFIGDLAILLEEWAVNKPSQKDFDIEKFKLSLLHFKVDAAMYKKSEYFRYCIKPYSKKQEVVTLMTIKTSSALEKKRIGQLRDLVSVLMLEKSRYIINKQNKELLEANSSMAMEEEHYKKHEVSAIQTRLALLSNIFPELQEHTQFIYAQKSIAHLLDVSSFYMTMMKKNAMETHLEDINIRNLLMEKLDIMLHSLDLFGLKSDHIEKILAKQQDILNIAENISNRIHVRFNPIALQIITAELIKNAIRFSDRENPYFTIQWLDYGDCYHLEFKNNATVSKEQLDFMNDNLEKITTNYKLSGGLRSVKRILKYYDETEWKLGAKRNSDESRIIIYIKIPKTAVRFTTPKYDNDIINF